MENRLGIWKRVEIGSKTDEISTMFYNKNFLKNQKLLLLVIKTNKQNPTENNEGIRLQEKQENSMEMIKCNPLFTHDHLNGCSTFKLQKMTAYPVKYKN